MKRLLFLLSLVLLANGLLAQKKSASSKRALRTQPSQGICGTVLMKRGNYMPSPDTPRRNPNGTPVEREVLIFPLLNRSQIDAGENGFITSVREAKPIKTVHSDKNGEFCVSLPVGRYSVIVNDPKGLYANLSDTHNNIFPVGVQKNRQSTVKVEITHDV